MQITFVVWVATFIKFAWTLLWIWLGGTGFATQSKAYPAEQAGHIVLHLIIPAAILLLGIFVIDLFERKYLRQ